MLNDFNSFEALIRQRKPAIVTKLVSVASLCTSLLPSLVLARTECPAGRLPGRITSERR